MELAAAQVGDVIETAMTKAEEAEIEAALLAAVGIDDFGEWCDVAADEGIGPVAFGFTGFLLFVGGGYHCLLDLCLWYASRYGRPEAMPDLRRSSSPPRASHAQGAFRSAPFSIEETRGPTNAEMASEGCTTAPEE